MRYDYYQDVFTIKHLWFGNIVFERSRLVNHSVNLTPCTLISPILYKAYMLNVRDQMVKYTKHEVERAKRTRELQWKLGVSTPQ